MLEAPPDDPRAQTVRRLLERYLIEVVEELGLCPWAHAARVRGELEVVVGLGAQCSGEEAEAACRRALARPGAAVVMLVLPELVGGARAVDALRNELARRLPEAGVAAFGPHAKGSLDSAAKLVPLLRGSPDPMLQLVPFSLLDSVRRAPTAAVPDLAAQARALAGLPQAPQPTVPEAIAARNYATVLRDHGAALLRTLGELARARAALYPAAGLELAPSTPD